MNNPNISSENNFEPMRIGVAGCLGRVGSLICKELLSSNEHLAKNAVLAVGTVGEQDQDFIGRNIAEIYGYSVDASNATIVSDPEEMFSYADAVIDFTSPAAVKIHAGLSARYRTSYILGTTGLSLSDEKELEIASEKTAVIYAPNMSIGVNVLLSLSEKLASVLGEDWDTEIFEAHHKNKADAPSGTALALGKSVAKGRNRNFDDIADLSRVGNTGKRQSGNIGFAVARGGDVVGEHSVTFYAEGERISVSHMATNRSLFAVGAIKAALWSNDKDCGLYSMRDVLGL